MSKIAEDMNRSPQTINRHIIEHNKEVASRGFCIKCRRINNRYATVEV